MMKFARSFKLLLVIMGAMALTAIGVLANDRWQRTVSICPEGMVEIPTARSFTCVDQYEAAPSVACPYQTITNTALTAANLTVPECTAVSKENAEPWRFVNREEARILCARAGKRLPGAEEWYQYSLTSSVAGCNITEGTVETTGFRDQCKTTEGIYDTIGNLWEWMGDDVSFGAYQNRTLPPSGYVTEVDAGGVAASTSAIAPESFMGYAWTGSDGVKGMLRGGFYNVAKDAAIYTLQANVDPTFTGAAIGFRCIR